MKLQQLKIDLVEQRNLLTDKEKAFESAIEERNEESAKEIMAELEAIKARIDELAEKVAELEETEEETDEQETEEQEQEETEENDEERNLLKGADEQMEQRQILDEGHEKAEVRAFENYIVKRAIEDGVKTDGNQVIIPEDIKTEIINLVDDKFKLKDLVTVEQVTNANGKRKVRTNTNTRLSTVPELDKNPQIAVTELDDVNYEIDTKRGYVPISQEAIDDGVMTLEQIKSYIGEVAVNTENHDIMQVLGTITGKEVSTVDGLKDIVNTQFPVVVGKSVQFLLSQSVYNEIDKLKDGNGRYLLQDSISSPSGKTLFGKDVIVLDDVELPTKQTSFVGNFKEIVYFDRADLRVEWTNYLHYGQCLSPILRNDVKKSRKNLNIKKFIFKPEVDNGEEEGTDTP